MTEYASNQDTIDVGPGEAAHILSGAVIGADPTQSRIPTAVQMAEGSSLLVEGAISQRSEFSNAGIRAAGASQIDIAETGSVYCISRGIEAKGSLSLTNDGLINSNASAVYVDGPGNSTITNNGSISTSAYGIYFMPSTEHNDIQRVTNTGNIKASTVFYGWGKGSYFIDNQGSMDGDKGIELSLIPEVVDIHAPIILTGRCEISNSGTIIAQNYALNIGGFPDTIVLNSGLIVGRVYLDAGLLRNTGTIRGDILIDGGTYDGRGGRVEGTIDLGAGTGTAYGGSGSETIIGGWGEDYIDGGEGADRMIGGTWNDTFVVDDASDVVVELSGEGNDAVLARTSYALSESTSVEVLKAFDASATISINLAGNRGNNSIVGNAGANVLEGQAGADTLDGGIGDDTLSGGDGDDVIKGGSGIDTVVFAGSKRDYTFSLGADDTLFMKGIDTDAVSETEYFRFADGTFTFDQIRQEAQSPVVEMPVGQPPIVLNPPSQPQPPVVRLPASIETEGSVTLQDGVLNVTAIGSARVILTGNAQDNRLTGNVGKNTIDGKAGRDRLDGGYGNDTLSGGTGQDIFVFSTKLGNSRTDRSVNFDAIKDFSAKDDSIFLDNGIFKKVGLGTPLNPKPLSKSYFAFDKAKDANDYLIYNKKTGVLSYDADGSRKGQAIEFAQLKKGLTLTYKDFFVI